MSRLITDVIKESLQKVVKEQYGNLFEELLFTVEPTRDKAHGDFASNIAFCFQKPGNPLRNCQPNCIDS